jgi:hypothetical protein
LAVERILFKLIILPIAAIKKAQFFGLVLDTLFTLIIQSDENPDKNKIW